MHEYFRSLATHCAERTSVKTITSAGAMPFGYCTLPLRFWNNDVTQNLGGVLQRIHEAL